MHTPIILKISFTLGIVGLFFMACAVPKSKNSGELFLASIVMFGCAAILTAGWALVTVWAS